MHTLKAIFGGFLLLGVCLLLGRWIGGAAATVVATTIKYFLVLWLAATLVNMWVGVSKDRKSTRLNSSHLGISYAVFCLKKKNKHRLPDAPQTSQRCANIPERSLRHPLQSCWLTVLKDS